MISEHVLDKLEYRKVLQFISKYSITENGRDEILTTKPFNNLDRIKLEGKLVDQAKEILITNNNPPIEHLSNLNDPLSKSKIEGTALEGKKINEILKLAIVSRNLFQFLKNNSGIAPDILKLTDNLFVDKLFEHKIKNILSENGEVKENASAKLSEIKKQIRNLNEQLIKSVNRIIKSLKGKDIVQEDYITLRDGRIVIPVKAEHKRHIRGFIHSESSTGQTVYIEPEETLELNNEIVSYSFAEKREIERLLKELTKVIAAVSEELKKSLSAVSYIDSIFARAEYSIEIIGAFPEISLPAAGDQKNFEINEARHPILQKKLGREKTIPLNLNISKSKVILITGPNAGGKTVVLKTLGLLTLMVNSGIHIPAGADSNFYFFKKLFLDIGDEQSIEDDLSTFSSHLSNIKNILEKSDENSLVLIDEIGTGTDPAEGAALAAAFLIKLKEKKSTVLATTHYGALKLITNDIEGFENAAMEFDNENLIPTYSFKQGIPGSSYAFEIAKRIGFNDDILQLASKHLDLDKHKVENFLVEIEAKSKLAEDKFKKAEIENARLEGLSNLYKKNIDKLNREKKEILKQTKSEAEDYLKDLNRKFEKIIKDIKESNASKNVIKGSKKIIDDLKESSKNKFAGEEIAGEKYDLKTGDFASIKNTSTKGEILKISKEKNTAVLKVGLLKMQVDLKNLVPSKKDKEKDISAKPYDFSSIDSSRIDIRGERSDEAEFEIIKFLDNAYTTGLEKIEILHGKGTGALKKTVHDILKHHEKIKTFYFAPIEMGGEGITIAEFV